MTLGLLEVKKKKALDVDINIAYATILKHLRKLSNKELDALSFLIDVEIRERNFLGEVKCIG